MKSIALLFLLLPIIGHAQNLVPNGSFEEYTECPDGLDQVYHCEDWVSSYGTCDYYNACANPGGLGIPNNVVGNQLGMEGQAYCGLLTYDDVFENREYLSVELSSPLNENTEYYFSMRVCRANKQVFDMASSNIGIKITNQLYTTQSEWMDNTSFLSIDTVVTDSVGWTLLKGQFFVESPNTHLTIGNFYSDSNTLIQTSNEVFDRWAYYYIDDVRLSPDSAIGWPLDLIEYQNKEVQSHFMASSEMLIYNSISYGLFRIYSVAGQICHAGRISMKENYLDISSMAKGIYFFLFIGENGENQVFKFIRQ